MNNPWNSHNLVERICPETLSTLISYLWPHYISQFLYHWSFQPLPWMHAVPLTWHIPLQIFPGRLHPSPQVLLPLFPEPFPLLFFQSLFSSCRAVLTLHYTCSFENSKGWISVWGPQGRRLVSTTIIAPESSTRARHRVGAKEIFLISGGLIMRIF